MSRCELCPSLEARPHDFEGQSLGVCVHCAQEIGARPPGVSDVATTTRLSTGDVREQLLCALKHAFPCLTALEVEQDALMATTHFVGHIRRADGKPGVMVTAVMEDGDIAFRGVQGSFQTLADRMSVVIEEARREGL